MSSSSESITAVDMRIDPLAGFTGYIPVNDDDDNANGIRDKDGGPLAQNDNDLFEFALVGSAKDADDYVQLEIESHHPDPAVKRSIKVWNDQKRTQLILPAGESYAAQWSQSPPPKIYVEGMRPTTGVPGIDGGDPRLYWTYFAWDDEHENYVELGQRPDEVEYEWLTVLHVDMDMQGVRDGLEGDNNVTEETTPGGFVPLGGLTQLYVYPVRGTTLNPGLVLTVAPSNRIRVWKDEAKTQPVTFGQVFYYNSEIGISKSLWVEGLQVSSSSADVTLTLQPKFGSSAPMSEPYVDKIKLTVFDPGKKIPLGGSPSLSTWTIGKVYVPTKYGGALTLTGASISLYYTDGSDLSVAKAVQILKGELDGNRVATGNPCVYSVPNDAYGWYYVRITAATPTSVSGTFVESGEVSRRPWNGWFWPKQGDVTLYADGGPLEKFDAIYSTTAKNWEATNDSSGPDYAGHCAGWAIASVLLDQPNATSENGVSFARDDMEGLYTELAEGSDATASGPLSVSQIDAGPPTSATGEQPDTKCDDVHKVLRDNLRRDQTCRGLVSNLRDGGGSNPDAVWYHAIWKYESSMQEAPGGDEQLITFTTVVTANHDLSSPPTDGTSNRTETWIYRLRYSYGDISADGTGQNWISTSHFAPYCILRVTGTAWNAKNTQVTKARVDSLYN